MHRLTPVSLVPLVVLAGAMTCGPSTPDVAAGLQDINGTPLFIRTIGTGDPVLVVHGGPALDHGYLLPGFEELGTTHRVILYDQRASGQSPAELNADAINLNAFIDDIDGIRQVYEIERLKLIGHSFGAYLAVEYAVKHPDRVSHLILSNPTEPGHRFDSLVNTHALALRTTEDSLAIATIQSSAEFSNRDPATLATLFHAVFRSAFHDRARANALNISFAPAGADAVFQVAPLLFPSGRRTDHWDALAQLQVPTLLIGGESDNVPRALLDALGSTMPEAAVEIIAGAGHFPFIEAPTEYFGVIRRFFSGS